MTTAEHTGKIAFITGGGQGFGLAFGRQLAERGAHVVLADIDGSLVESAAAELRASGLAASGVQCDVADEERVADVMAAVIGEHGGLDMLINNAGLHSAAFNKPSAELGVERIRRLFEVNVMGVIICTLAAAPAMAGRPGASVVNISSSAAYASRTAYGVSKLAVRGATAQFAHELAGQGIRVNAIAPGLIFTDTVRAELPKADVDRVMGQQILRREGEVADVVAALLYLVSDQASFVTGETLRVTGGFALSV